MNCVECAKVTPVGIEAYGKTDLCFEHLELRVVDSLPKRVQKLWHAGRIDVAPSIVRAIKVAEAPGKAGRKLRAKADKLRDRVKQWSG